MNFKGVQTLCKKSGKFPKIYLDLIFTKVNLVGHTCMKEIGVPIQVPIWHDLKIRKRVWIWNWNSNQNTLGFHSSFEVIERDIVEAL
jgi:hypothetical protein